MTLGNHQIHLQMVSKVAFDHLHLIIILLLSWRYCTCMFWCLTAPLQVKKTSLKHMYAYFWKSYQHLLSRCFYNSTTLSSVTLRPLPQAWPKHPAPNVQHSLPGNHALGKAHPGLTASFTSQQQLPPGFGVSHVLERDLQQDGSRWRSQPISL